MVISLSMESLHGFGGVIDQIGDGALDGLGIGHDGGQIVRQVSANANAFQTPAEKSERAFDELVEAGRLRAGGGEARQHGEFIDQAADGFDGIVDGVSAGANDFERGGIRRGAAREMTMNALGGKSDGSQGIFYFVRNAARDLTPGGLLLCAQQIGEIFEDQNISEARGGIVEGGDGDGHVELGVGQRDFHVGGGEAHAIGAAQERFEIVEHVKRQEVCAEEDWRARRDSRTRGDRDETCGRRRRWRG